MKLFLHPQFQNSNKCPVVTDPSSVLPFCPNQGLLSQNGQAIQANVLKGTIHLRRRQIITIFDPYPLPSAFQQNANEGDFLSLCTVTF